MFKTYNGPCLYLLLEPFHKGEMCWYQNLNRIIMLQTDFLKKKIRKQMTGHCSFTPIILNCFLKHRLQQDLTFLWFQRNTCWPESIIAILSRQPTDFIRGTDLNEEFSGLMSPNHRDLFEQFWLRVDITTVQKRMLFWSMSFNGVMPCVCITHSFRKQSILTLRCLWSFPQLEGSRVFFVFFFFFLSCTVTPHCNNALPWTWFQLNVTKR